MATSQLGYTSSGFLIELDGKPVGYALAASGGEALGLVEDESPDGSGLIKKHLGGVRYEPIVLQITVGMTAPVYEWIASVPARTQKPHEGAVVFVDYNHAETGRLSWKAGVISKIVFPAFDATSKDAGRIEVTIQPLSTESTKSTGSAAKPSYAMPGGQKRFQPSNFRVTIDGLPTFSGKVLRIEPITVRQDVILAGGELTLGAVHLGDLELIGREAFSTDLRAWFQDFVVKGNNSDKEERSVLIEALTSDLKGTLFSLKFDQVGVYAAASVREDEAVTATSVAKLKAGLYAEELDVTFETVAIAAEVKPAAPTTTAVAAPGGATAGPTVASSPEVYFASWRAGLRPARPVLSAEAVASRLMRTPESVPPAAEVITREDEGRRFGEVWAREIATKGELDGLSELSGGEWTTVTLSPEHSLLWVLDQAGETADRDVTSLSDDPFVRGIVEGAASVRRELQGQLGDQPPD